MLHKKLTVFLFLADAQVHPTELEQIYLQYNHKRQVNIKKGACARLQMMLR